MGMVFLNNKPIIKVLFNGKLNGKTKEIHRILWINTAECNTSLSCFLSKWKSWEPEYNLMLVFTSGVSCPDVQAECSAARNASSLLRELDCRQTCCLQEACNLTWMWDTRQQLDVGKAAASPHCDAQWPVQLSIPSAGADPVVPSILGYRSTTSTLIRHAQSFAWVPESSFS